MARAKARKIPDAIGQTDERAHVALQATWQLAGIFDELVDVGVRLDQPDTLHESAIVKALAARGQALTSAAMSMLGDGMAEVKTAQTVVQGKEEISDERLPESLAAAP